MNKRSSKSNKSLNKSNLKGKEFKGFGLQSSLSQNPFLKKKSSQLISSTSAAAAALFLSPAGVFALPQGLEVQRGVLSVNQSSENSLTINQGSNRAVGNWNSFDINTNEAVQVVQPSASSVMVGRIVGGEATQILGNLNANGSIILTNPHGMVFGKDAVINTSNFSASTLDIDPDQIMQGGDSLQLNRSLLMPSDAQIINKGSITVSESGLASLIAPRVVNEGLITAKFGQISIASGTKATLDISGDGLLSITLDDDVAGSVDNTGTLSGQYIRLGGGVANDFVNSTINLEGVVKASGFNSAGTIDVNTSGDISVKGDIDASSVDSDGGTIKLLGGDTVDLIGSASVNADGSTGGGEILIGGNYLGRGPEPNSKTTIVRTGAEISADATSSGDGVTQSVPSAFGTNP